MTTTDTLHDYLVLSRGQWDESLPAERIQAAIDDFYVWYSRSLEEGTMKPGHRLARTGKLITRERPLDGPFAETKELIGGYWFIRARSLDEAVAIAARNPCLACGLQYEIRPLENERASAFARTCETPDGR